MAEFQDRPVNLLKSKMAKYLYDCVKDLPIIDYHCHLSPKEIYEDKPFEDIGQMWLSGDHYKWRLMRAYGVDEEYITGSKSYEEKFYKFIEAVSFAYGNPIRDWVALELEMFFDITMPLTTENAKAIWDKANACIKEKKLSPRKLIEQSKVEYIATTDDPTDSLEYHKLLKEDETFKTICAPSFRVDNLLLAQEEDYPNYIKKLADAANMTIHSLDTLKKAILNRMDFFKEMGCKFSDVGIQNFPTRIASEEEASQTLDKFLLKSAVSEYEYDGYVGYLYVFLAKAYKERNIVMQLHLAVTRNSNLKMFKQCGRDAGFDCVGSAIDITYIRNIINEMNNCDGLPETIIYTLNPTMYYTLITMIGAFRNVHLGISWWFLDHKRGMFETLEMLSELSHITSLVGMLTDSRSFLSYVRHDYYRQIVCEFLARLIDKEDKNALFVAKALCYDNAKKMIKE